MIAAAIAAAPQEAVSDPDNPPTQAGDWNDAIIVHEGGYPAVQAALEERQRSRRPCKAPKKILTTIPFDADVLAGLRATGKGWRAHVNDLMREWLARRE
ncbi:BrnA antitoxin family protein [Thiorhodococcus mannitoliphagus]|uniref:BrnA antitoxin family protein n=1 Tax=Thiorhodococcus mannitoliphagus TaxID=329406 RepID=A0A6P1E0S0_9GAMM|nr:BrnA antitoxin family protein [Thiorhodococcus mannitoliphagus]NEX22911.1 BrnA antitoxin family protein [Thiorhodococcus mannitoliphagus]